MSEPSLHSRKSIVSISKHTFRNARYELIRKIADGSEGSVWEAKNTNSAKAVAIKFYAKEFQWERERKMIKNIKMKCGENGVSEKFISIEDSDQFEHYYFTTFDLCKRTLETHIKEEVADDRIGLELLAILQTDILPALIFLESIGVCHGISD
jgi:serine/threonine protein kinase